MYILAGKHYRRKLIVPKGMVIRPTFSRLKGTLFDILQNEIVGASFLDLFAGSGGIGLEALSRGAKQVTFVEKEKKGIEAIRENVQLLGEEKASKVVCADVFEALTRLVKQGEIFDIIFADPPYGTLQHSFSNEVLAFVDTHPLLKKGGSLFLEDEIKASIAKIECKNLSLKSTRHLGRSTLRHYESTLRRHI